MVFLKLKIMEYFLIYCKLYIKLYKLKMNKIRDLYDTYKKWSLLVDEELKNLINK
jgi:hypothetical protein